MTPAPANNIPRYTPARIRKRRATFFTLVGVTLVIGIWLLADSLSNDGLNPLEIAMLAVFAPLFYQLCVGFWTAFIGLYVSSRRTADPLNLARSLTIEERAAKLTAGTAIIMPVYNEDVSRVFEGLRVIYESLAAKGHLEHFDFFVLSDSDNPNKWVEEELAWLELCRQLNAFGRIFYRKRRKPINRKSGNVSDFCRRWGRRYRYMVVLDADSIMGGTLLADMVRLMEKHPAIGMIQTSPRVFGAETLFGRVMQFAHAVYGEPFMAGLNYLAMGNATFWGHNAIIRLAPFIEDCALPELPGREPFGGHILSHDFVEAALMQKAGYQVWLLPVSEDSYEEGPPTLLDTLKRDRRWCQGNMQHIKLLFAKGWSPLARLNFMHGILSYLASPLWLLFLVLATILAGMPGEVSLDFREGDYAGIVLLAITIGLLFVPKFLILFRQLRRPDVARQFHSRRALTWSVALDTVFFTIMAPILMLFHSKFVFYTLLGRGVRWAEQRRKSDGSVDWQESIMNLSGITVFALLWAVAAWWQSPVFLRWISPVLTGIALAIPFSIVTAGRRSGKSKGLFSTFEELDPPKVLSDLTYRLEQAHERSIPLPALAKNYGLLQAALDPYVNALHVSLLRHRQRTTPESRDYLDQIRKRIVKEGPDALTKRELSALMYDPDMMLRLHYDLWSGTGEGLAQWWDDAIKQYNILTREPVTALYR
ncbi:MAG TPA: glucans biosynthesis glucosyltransferase MdoH [Verrucomicrobiales bacterium]|nr:glucans biosynthesis glucosyltransferase MdoH [Verrucomicrobiales bacterium]